VKIQVTPIEKRADGDREIKPPVKCFCCWDSGRASNQFLSEFVDIPQNGDFLPFICKRYNCEAGEKLITAYEKSDQEREAIWAKITEKSPDTPKFMRQRDYQANWSTALPTSACETMHKWGFDQWVDECVKKVRSHQPPTQSIAAQFDQAVSDREKQIANIKILLMGIDEVTAKRIEGFVQKYRDRDQVNYPNWEALPSAAHEVLFKNLRSLAA